MHNKQAIGILGGTFDPIHIGHLRLAIELQETLALARVHIVPCFEPVHRKLPIATPEQRFNMVAQVTENNVHLVADNREIKRGIPSFTIDTLIEMRHEIQHVPFCVLLGIDAFLGFLSWHRWEEILQLAHIVVAYRPNYLFPNESPIADLIAKHKQEDVQYIHHNMAGGIIFRPMTALEVSASDIRKQFATNRNPRFLIPDRVYDYIKQNHLYQTLL